jgi:hypothetical protein
MNAPVNEAIENLQQCLTTLQTSFLSNDLINSPSVLRTIRASNSLESAQVAWSRFLNLPGRTSRGDSESTDSTGGSLRKRFIGEAEDAKTGRPAPSAGEFYNHEELWGRGEAVVQHQKQRTGTVEDTRVGLPFVG